MATIMKNKLNESEFNNVVVIDTETGGLDPIKNGLCSITLKKYDKDTSEEVIKTIYVKPNKKLEYSESAMRINGLDLDFLEIVGLTESEAVNKISEFLDEHCNYKPNVLGHNVRFDINFLDQLFLRNNAGSFEEKISFINLDTINLAFILKSLGMISTHSLRLASCYREQFDEEFPAQHTSEGDALATEKLFTKYMELIRNYEW